MSPIVPELPSLPSGLATALLDLFLMSGSGIRTAFESWEEGTAQRTPTGLLIPLGLVSSPGAEPFLLSVLLLFCRQDVRLPGAAAPSCLTHCLA